MQAIAGEIQIVVSITLLLFLITSFIVVFIFVHQSQYHKYIQDKEEMKNTFQQEILKAQLEMKEQTLHTVSQEIHDNIGQILSLVKLNLHTVLLEEDNPANAKITVTKELVGKAIQDLRNLSKTLNTEHIVHLKLSEVLRIELDMIQKTGLYTTQLKVKGSERPLDPQKQLILFRIAQETFNNILKHAKAQSIQVWLDYLPEQLTMRIQDNGAGFERSSGSGTEKGTGLNNMYHRARLIGAEFEVNSQLGKGTLTRLTLPI
jgi:two-component system, NarL family, sensor kinase